jgi:SAM-dependent methyltransferase
MSVDVGDAGGRHAGFTAFELAGWQVVADAYDAGFAGLTSQAAGPLLDAAGVTAGARVLDVATGPGYVAEAAARLGARVSAIDFSPSMVERARERVRTADVRVGDAEALPFEDAVFDAVVMNFGLLHLERPERAVREAARVLRPGGRFAFTTWAPPEETVGFGIVLRAVATHGEPDVPLPEGPPFFRFSDPEECRSALCDAGLADPRVLRTPQTWRLPHDDDLFRVMLEGTVRTSALLRGQRPEALAAIREATAAEAARHRRNGQVELAMPAVLATAGRSRRAIGKA